MKVLYDECVMGSETNVVIKIAKDNLTIYKFLGTNDMSLKEVVLELTYFNDKVRCIKINGFEYKKV